VSHLEQVTSDDLAEAIARALTQKNFQNALPALLRRFERTSSDAARWAIGNAIAYHPWPKDLWEKILALAVDPKFGRGRQNLVWRLHRINLRVVEPRLITLVEDRDVDAFALIALRYCGSIETWKALETLDPTGRTPLFKRELAKIAKRLRERLEKNP
jgi:hypothetical protein